MLQMTEFGTELCRGTKQYIWNLISSAQRGIFLKGALNRSRRVVCLGMAAGMSTLNLKETIANGIVEYARAGISLKQACGWLLRRY